jgi:hypothetical protein
LVVELAYRYFFSKFFLSCQQLFPLFAPVATLPPVSTTLAKMVEKFATDVVDTGGKLAAVTLIPAAILPSVALTPVTNLPTVSLIPVMHLDLRIFEKIRNGLNGILWGWGKLIHEKN